MSLRAERLRLAGRFRLAVGEPGSSWLVEGEGGMRAGCPLPLGRRRPAWVRPQPDRSGLPASAPPWPTRVSTPGTPRPLRWFLVLGLVLGILSMPHAIGGAANSAGHAKHVAGMASAAAVPLAGQVTGAPASAGAPHIADQTGAADLRQTVPGVALASLGLDRPALTTPSIGSWPTGQPGPGIPMFPVLLCLVVLAMAVILTVAAGRPGRSLPAWSSSAAERLVARLRLRPGSQVLLDKCVLRT